MSSLFHSEGTPPSRPDPEPEKIESNPPPKAIQILFWIFAAVIMVLLILLSIWGCVEVWAQIREVV